MDNQKHPLPDMSRRGFLAGSAIACAGGAVANPALGANAESKTTPPGVEIPPEDYRIEKGRIRQSVMGWCFKPTPTEELIEVCHRMGMPAMEGINAKFYPKLREKKMVPAIVGSHGFKKGPLNSDHHAMCVEKIRAGIDKAAEFGSPGVIVFTGMREKGISDEQADRNCVECWKKIIPYAEEKEVNLVLEHLNSRDDTHPMKGHPGYYGDDVDHCVELIKKVREGRPHIVDAMKSGQVQLVFNTTEDAKAIADSFELRRTALTNSVPYSTTVAGARAAVKAIEALKSDDLAVAPLQSYFTGSY